MRFAVLACLMASSYAQVRISYSQQGAQTVITTAGKKVRGVGICGVIVSNTDAVERLVDSGEIYASFGRNGHSWTLPDTGTATISRVASTSKAAITMDIFSVGATLGGGAGLAGMSGLVHMGNGWTTALTAASAILPPVLNYFKGRLAKQQPASITLIPASGSLHVPPHSSMAGALMYTYQGPWKPFEVQVQ